MTIADQFSVDAVSKPETTIRTHQQHFISRQQIASE
jgi:hypothetical protein